MKDRNILIVGANRGLGLELAHQYADAGKIVYATARHIPPLADSKIHWIPNFDITKEDAGNKIFVKYLDSQIDLLIVCAGYFAKETLEGLDYDKEVAMYKTNAIGPTFLISHLLRVKLLGSGSRIVLVSGESGSIQLRHPEFGGGNYGGHGSKAALNMCGKLLANEFEKSQKGISVAIVHTGYLRKQNPDGTWETGGKNALNPAEAATKLKEWITTSFDHTKNGEFWSVRGPDGIRTASLVLGDNLPTPLQLPW